MIKIMIAVVILACVAPFFIKGPNGEPLMTLDKLMNGSSSSSATASAASKREAPQPTTVYKWQDENGVWHFSDREEDAEVAGAEKVELTGDINLMPAFKEPPKPSTVQAQAPATQSTPIPSIGAGLDTLNQAKELQSSIDSRKEEIDKAIKQAGG